MGINFNITVKKRFKSKKEINPKVVFLILTIAFMGAGIFIICYLANLYVKYQDSKSWDKVSCKIISSKVFSKTSTDSEGRSSTTYDLDIKYSYTYHDKKHYSTLYKLDGNSFAGFRHAAYAARNHNKPGHSSWCYVNPQNPSVAVISRDFPIEWYVIIAMLIFPTVGILLLFVTIGIFTGKISIDNKRQKNKRNHQQAKEKGKLLTFGFSKPTPHWVILAAGMFFVFILFIISHQTSYPKLMNIVTGLVVCIVVIVWVKIFLSEFSKLPKIRIGKKEIIAGRKLEIKWNELEQNSRFFKMSLLAYETIRQERYKSKGQKVKIIENIDIYHEKDCDSDSGKILLAVPAQLPETSTSPLRSVNWKFKVEVVGRSSWALKRQYEYSVTVKHPRPANKTSVPDFENMLDQQQ